MMGKVSKKQERQARADSATMTMEGMSGSCGSTRYCPNPPTVSIGGMLFCDTCLANVKLDYPASFSAYWEPKLVRLA
jgi:hypothetical protein